MVKPLAFQNAFVALNNIPYLCSDASGKEKTASGGVLSRGQVVWLRDGSNPFGARKSTMAFVEGIGLISLDPRWLASNQTDLADAENRKLHGRVLGRARAAK